MLTKGNDAKVQNEVMAQIVADTSAKWMKFTRLIPKQEIEENSQYYTYMSQRVNGNRGKLPILYLYVSKS